MTKLFASINVGDITWLCSSSLLFPSTSNSLVATLLNSFLLLSFRPQLPFAMADKEEKMVVEEKDENGDEVVEEQTQELDPLLKLSELRFMLTLPSDVYSDVSALCLWENKWTKEGKHS